jgi:hypothetical protein
MNIFDKDCVNAIKAEIQKQLDADKIVTRKSVIAALNLGKDTELALSVMFKLGAIPEYRTLQKLGIKPSSYASTKERAALKPKRTRKSKKDAAVVDDTAEESAVA